MSFERIEIGGPGYREALRAFARDRRGVLVVPDHRAAEGVAKDLGVDLYRIDLSAIISKYIGETEKNLDRVFGAVEGSGLAIFLDGADAVFGERAGAAAVDRSVPGQVPLLLARVAQIDGLAVVASRHPDGLSEELRLEIRAVLERP
jgi:SpoVK/Ycf46/Vps4 family AAA+-type ATPase